MATATVDIGTLIAHSPQIRGGRPCVAGTGVTVQRIVGWYKPGLSLEEIAERIGHLSLAQVHAALTYYHANRKEIEDAMAEDETAGDQAEEEWGAFVLRCDKMARPLRFLAGMSVLPTVDAVQCARRPFRIRNRWCGNR